MRRSIRHRAAIAIALLAAAVPAVAQTNRVLHRERSLYRNILVTQDGDERCMLFRAKLGLGKETCKYLSRPNVHPFGYTQMMMAGLFLNPRPQRILIVGLGGGTIPNTLAQIVPNAEIDNVEIDQAVANVAVKYFGFRATPKNRLTVQDGRVFVKRQLARGVKYDMVMLDAFDGDYIPEHLLTQEFLQEVKGIMTPTGVIVANTFPNTKLYPYESVTYRAVFGAFYNMKASNRVIVSRLGPRQPLEEITANANALAPAMKQIGTSSQTLLRRMSTGVDWDPNTPVLTDQFSPSNVLNAQR